MRLYLDTSILIRCFEGDVEEKSAALRWIDRAESAPGGTIVSGHWHQHLEDSVGGG